MKNKAVKILLIIFGVILISALSFYIYCTILTLNINLDKNKLVDMNSSVEIYDGKGNILDEWSDGKSITDLGDIPDYTLNAFVAIEDKRFYSHNGTDFKGFLRAAFNNLKSLSFKEGASTISQQLIKNTHLSGEKTLKRKLAEIKLAGQLEKEYSKKEILEMYVNTIYFGDGCYGITKAANNYFGVSPSELTVNQSAALAGMIKAPALYSPKMSLKNCNARKNLVLKEMYEQKYITEEEYNKSKNIEITCVENDADISSPYLKLVKNELDRFIEKTAQSFLKLKVYTYYDREMQSVLEKAVENSDVQTDKKAVILDNQNKIKAFYSTCGDTARQLGSTVKPLAVYAPAIDMNVIDSCTLLNDEKINFNGYAPSNYKNKYYGYVSAKFALSKSLNSCAVKLLNDCGTENCLAYLKKTDIPVTENDAALCLALGATEHGATLIEISGAYGAFINQGLYSSPSVIGKICNEQGKTVYSDSEIPVRIYGEDTAFIINDMLKNTVNEGTAKKLSGLKIPLAAKTGTVGTEKGNTDAYCVSYNGDNIVACWLGNADGTLMPNSISGGTKPTETCYNVWNGLIKQGFSTGDTFKSDRVAEINIDKLSYEENRLIETADENAPERYVLKEYFKLNRIPKSVSSRFSYPKIEDAKISVNKSQIHIKLCLAEYCDYKVFRETDGIKTQIYDSYGKKNKTEFTDNFVLPDKKYKYSVLPYFSGQHGVKFGEEYSLQEIKTPPIKGIGDEWWKDIVFDFD